MAKEVAHWVAGQGVARLLIAVTSGELVWDPAAGDFDRYRTSCLPEELYGRFTEEPRWVDLRDMRSAHRLSVREPTFGAKVADLAAPLHGVDKDDLVGEDIRHPAPADYATEQARTRPPRRPISPTPVRLRSRRTQ